MQPVIPNNGPPHSLFSRIVITHDKGDSPVIWKQPVTATEYAKPSVKTTLPAPIRPVSMPDRFYAFTPKIFFTS